MTPQPSPAGFPKVADPIDVGGGWNALPARPIRPDLRDHTVLAGALGLAYGSTDPVVDGADDVAILSAAIAARWPDVRSYTADEIAAGPRPFGLRLPKWRALWFAEARLNWPNWIHDLTAQGGPETPAAPGEVLDLAKQIAACLDGRRLEHAAQEVARDLGDRYGLHVVDRIP